VWRIPMAGGELRRRGLALKGLRELRVHPDGRQIAFVAGSDKTEVWALENFLPAAQTAKASAPRQQPRSGSNHTKEIEPCWVQK
jgi:hypothetical protein